MSTPISPWVRSLAASASRRTAGFLLALGWTMAGISLWTVLGLREWQVGQRPAIVLEVFLGEVVTPAHVDSLSQSIQSQRYFCELRFVDPEEAWAEAGADQRLRPLLDAFGGNPFLKSFRLTICAEELEGYHEAGDWLKEQPGVISVRIPARQVEWMLESERQLRLVVRGAVALVTLLSILVALTGLRLVALELSRELDVFEELGATPWKIWVRTFWAIGAPALLLAVFVTITLELLSVLARFSGTWGSWIGAELPNFPHVAGVYLIAGALLAGLLVATVTGTARWFTKPR